MDLVMTGTGSPLPSPDRAGPSQLVQVGGRNLLIDCGRGCLMRLAGAATGPAAIERLLLTHLHSDHITDVNDLVTTRWITGFPAAPLPVVGPVGTAAFIAGSLKPWLSKTTRGRLRPQFSLSAILRLIPREMNRS